MAETKTDTSKAEATKADPQGGSTMPTPEQKEQQVKQRDERAAKTAEAEAKRLQDEYKEQLDKAPEGETGETLANIGQNAGSWSTLKQWEESPAGKAFIAARKGESVTEKLKD